MSPTKAWSLLVVLAVAAVAPRGAVVAQSTDVSCLPSFGWVRFFRFQDIGPDPFLRNNQMDNTKSQNPCLVVAYPASACTSGGKHFSLLHRPQWHNQFLAPWVIQSLPAASPGVQWFYTGPTLDGATGCMCNTVTYSLFSACGVCQNQTFERCVILTRFDFTGCSFSVSWSTWSNSCSTIYKASLVCGVILYS